ncbi:MAG: hypothetical protein WD378_09635 [Egicoccus sp.]
MSETRTPLDVEAVARAITSVPGVLKAKVVPSDSNGKGRLRVRVAPGEDHERVSWAVAATLRERFGIALDPAAFQLRVADGDLDADAATPDASGPTMTAHEIEGPEQDPIAVLEQAVAARLAEPAPAPADRDRYRAAIGDLVTQHGGAAVSVTATLEHNGRQGRAAVDALATSRARWRAVAEATVGALQELTGGRLRAQIDRVTVNTTEQPATVSVVLTALFERGEEVLLGGALLRDDPERAVMRATLDALNRRIEPWLAEATDA